MGLCLVACAPTKPDPGAVAADRIRAAQSTIVRVVNYRPANALDDATVDIYLRSGATRPGQQLW